MRPTGWHPEADQECADHSAHRNERISPHPRLDRLDARVLGLLRQFTEEHHQSVIASSLGTLVIAVVMSVTGVSMLGYAVRGVPKSPAAGSAQGAVVLVATKSKK